MAYINDVILYIRSKHTAHTWYIRTTMIGNSASTFSELTALGN